MTQSTLTVLAHSQNPPLQKLQQILHSLGWQIEVVRTPFGEPLPEISTVQGVVVLGAPAMLSQRIELDWIHHEMAWLEGVLARSAPVFGICFGCQMLAQIYGGKVYAGEKGREFGFTQVTQVEEDYLFTNDLDNLDVFQAHGDTYVLPSTAVRLLMGDVYQEQAARFGRGVYGTQFHPEVTPDIIARWHQFGMDAGRTFGEHVPATPAAHAVLAERKLQPVHAWLEDFLSRLFGEAQ